MLVSVLFWLRGFLAEVWGPGDGAGGLSTHRVPPGLPLLLCGPHSWSALGLSSSGRLGTEPAGGIHTVRGLLGGLGASLGRVPCALLPVLPPLLIPRPAAQRSLPSPAPSRRRMMPAAPWAPGKGTQAVGIW